MTFKSACLTSTALLILSISGVNAGETTNDAGAIVCVNDKWDEKEVEKGTQASRCRSALRHHSQRSRGTEVCL